MGIDALTEWCDENHCLWRVRYECCGKFYDCKISWADETGERPGSSAKHGDVTVIKERFIPIGRAQEKEFITAIEKAFSEAKDRYGWRKTIQEEINRP